MPNLVESSRDSQALIANDIRVLTNQLNETVKRGAEHGLRIQLEASTVIDMKGVA